MIDEIGAGQKEKKKNDLENRFIKCTNVTVFTA